MALVGAQVALAAHAEPLGDALAGEVGIVAPEADAQGAARAEQGDDRRRRRFDGVAPPQMRLVAEIA